MKKYTIARPAVQTYIQWDGSNVAEFEAMTANEWQWLSMLPNTTFVPNESNDLEIRTDDYAWNVVPLNHWTNGGTNYAFIEDSVYEQEVPSPTFNYIVG